MATHSSILAWKIPWTEEPGWLQSIGSHRVGTKGSFQLKIYIVYQVWGGSLYSNRQSQHVHKTLFWRNLNAINPYNPFTLPPSSTPGSFQACPSLCYTKYALYTKYTMYTKYTVYTKQPCTTCYFFVRTGKDTHSSETVWSCPTAQAWQAKCILLTW